MSHKNFTTLIILLTVGFIATVLFSSCSAEKRYKCLIKKHPELVETDTVYVTDTIIRELKVPVPEYRDSFIIKHDTIIETEKLIIYRKGDLLDITVKPDTITFRDTIPFEVKVPGKVATITKTNWTITWILLILGLILGVMINRK
jgi:hypothetical protein